MTRRRRPLRSRRGAALLLVLVALAVGLLLVATWLDGRRESVPIAQRVASGAVVRLAAASGLDLATATIDAEDDWRTAIDDGRFAEGVDLAGADCMFTVVDADTDARPGHGTVRLRIACTARLDEVSATVERILDVGTAHPVLDLGLSETAIVVDRTLRMNDASALLPWTARPGDAEGPLVVGSLDGRIDAVVVADAAITLDAAVLELAERGPSISDGGLRRLPDRLPAPTAPVVPGPDPERTLPSRAPIDLVTAPEGDIVSARVRVPGGTQLVVDGDRVVRSLGDVVLEHGAEVRVESGTLVLDAVRDLSIRGAEIVVADGARLVLRAGRELRIEDAVIVPDSIDPSSAAGEVPPLDRDVARSLLATLATPGASIEIGGRSAVVLAIVAPEGDVVVEDDAVLHGRILAADVELRHHATVYARPDDGRVIGLTTPVGPHRDDDGRLLDSVASADLATAAGLASVAAETGLEVVLLERIAIPDHDTVERLRDSILDRVRRAIEERRRRRPGPRWARGEEDDH